MEVKKKGLTALTIILALTVAVPLALPGCITPGPSLPEGLEITVVKLSPDFHNDGVVFLGTKERGVFRSDDRGDSWREINSGMVKTTVRRKGTPETGPLSAVEEVAFSPSFAEDKEIYMGAGWAGLYRSSDGGDNWHLLENAPPGHPEHIAISPDYQRDRTLFVSMTSDIVPYLWRSRDAGASWEQLSGPIEFVVPAPVQFLPDVSLVGATLQRASRSTDMGDHWTLLFRGETMRSFSFSPNFLEDGIAFFGDNTGHEKVRRMAAGQEKPVELGFKAAFTNTCHREGYGMGCAIPVAISPTFKDDGTAFASAYRGPDRKPLLMRSTDRGVTWEELTLPLPGWVISIAISPRFFDDHTVLVATGEALFRSEDGGDTWEQLHPRD